MSVSTPGADDLGLELLPPDERPVSADEELAASIAQALEDPLDPRVLDEEPPEPFGYTWKLDFERGRFVRAGTEPARVSGREALAEWAKMALHVARFAHPVFSEEFGIEDPDAGIGDAVGDEAEADLPQRIADALMVHDRITDVEVDGVELDPTTGVMRLGTLVIHTDDDAEPLRLAGLSVLLAANVEG